MLTGWFHSKNKYSLENLQNLYAQLTRFRDINETNRDQIVEILRAIAELMIWGDQHNENFFDFFCEKSILSYFIKILSQRVSKQIKVQLIQTLSILIQNVSKETSVYYLLSNNYINELIMHPFDFGDEEILAYYISFLKSLSLKLNKNTVQFFFNERLNQFPLYTEATKLFNHKESMVRIAVRTLTLNVYSVADSSMRKFLLSEPAVDYFSHLSCHLRDHWRLIDKTITESSPTHQNSLRELLAEHTDMLYYVQDIFDLGIEPLNEMLGNALLSHALLPVLTASVTLSAPEPWALSPLLALYMLNQVLNIFKWYPIVNTLAAALFLLEPPRDLTDWVILRPPPSPSLSPSSTSSASSSQHLNGFNGSQYPNSLVQSNTPSTPTFASPSADPFRTVAARPIGEPTSPDNVPQRPNPLSLGFATPDPANFEGQLAVSVSSNPCRDAFFGFFTHRDERLLLLALCVIYTVNKNTTIDRALVDAAQISPHRTRKAKKLLEALTSSLEDSNGPNGLFERKSSNQNQALPGRIFERPFRDSVTSDDESSSENHSINDFGDIVVRLIKVLHREPPLRVVTTRAVIVLLQMLAFNPNLAETTLTPVQVTLLEEACQHAANHLRERFDGPLGDFFLDLFEDEWEQLHNRRAFDIDSIQNNTLLLLPIAETPLSGVPLFFRVACGEVESTRKAIQMYLLLRQARHQLLKLKAEEYPFVWEDTKGRLKEGDFIDLAHRDMIACSVRVGNQKHTRYLVVDRHLLILVEPDLSRLGWAIVRTLAIIRNVEAMIDRSDPRTLQLAIRSLTQPGQAINSSHGGTTQQSVWEMILVFDDHVRCLAAKQHLEKSRARTRAQQMHYLSSLLEAHSQGKEPPDPSSFDSGSNQSTPSRGNSTSSLYGVGARSTSYRDAYSMEAPPPPPPPPGGPRQSLPVLPGITCPVPARSNSSSNSSSSSGINNMSSPLPPPFDASTLSTSPIISSKHRAFTVPDRMTDTSRAAQRGVPLSHQAATSGATKHSSLINDLLVPNGRPARSSDVSVGISDLIIDEQQRHPKR